MEEHIYIESEQIERERRKARELRRSTWWQRKRAKGVCEYCKKSFVAQKLTMDHIVPLAKGGLSIKVNIAVACKQCNMCKKASDPTEWQEYLLSHAKALS